MNCKLTLGEKLKDLRTAAGLSLVELEEATGISKSALGSYESDDTKKEITIAPLITLAKYYGVTTDYLLGMTDNKVQHGTPHSMQMQGSFWSSAIRVMLWLARYFWNR